MKDYNAITIDRKTGKTISKWKESKQDYINHKNNIPANGTVQYIDDSGVIYYTDYIYNFINIYIPENSWGI